MKISQIALRNFRSARNLNLDTDSRVTYVCGLNGVGKSTIRDAVRWVLRGVCQATDAKGLGWEALIPEGTTTLSAGVVLDGIGGVERSYTDGKRKLQLEGRDNDISSTQSAIYQLLETAPEWLDAVLETGYFIELHHAEAKAMVLGLLNVKIPVPLDPRTTEGGTELLTLDQVEGRYKVAYLERTAAKAKQKAHLVPTFTMPTDGVLPAVEDIKGRLAGLKVELQAELSKVGEASGRRQALTAELERVKAKGTATSGPRPSDDELAAARSTVAELEAEADRVSKLLEKRKPSAKAKAPDTADLEMLIKTLSAHRPPKGCVLDSNVPCKTHGNSFTKQVTIYKDRLAAAGAAPVDETPAPTFDAGSLAEARRVLTAVASRLNGFNEAAKWNQERQSEIDALTAQLSSLREDSQAVDTTAVETLQSRIAKGDMVLERAQAFWRDKKAYDVALETKKTLDAEVQRLEILCETLGPNGARVQALAEAIGKFESAINIVTKVFGWTVSFRLEPWTVAVNGRTIKAYSESEQFRIGIAIQMAVAAASGLGFLVVDRLDMLDRPNRNAVTNMLMESHDWLNQVVILATRDAEQPLPALPEVKAYRLHTVEGQTKVFESAGV